MNSELLIDQLFAATHRPDQLIDNPTFDRSKAGFRRAAKEIHDALIASQRYFLDEEVVRSATQLGVQHPDILLAMLPRGRLPFRKLWIEWDQRIAIDEAGQTSESDAPPRTGAYVEEISGIQEYPVYRITELGFAYDMDPPRASTNPTSIVYSVDQPILERMPALNDARLKLANFMNMSPHVMDLCLLGSAYQIDGNDEEGTKHRTALCSKLAAYATHTWSPFWPGHKELTGSKLASHYVPVFQNSILEFSGTWRFLMSVFALIQSREYTHHERIINPAKRRYVGNKQVPYLQYWRVSLKLPRKVVIRGLISSTRDALPRARHNVEGHWISRRSDDPTCDHVDVSETPSRYRCALCHRARYFQRDHMRGSAEVGFVKKDRVVERRN